ncbi:MAG TPA: hypothetical protein VGB70_06610 [Allosphingosinicella sp.]|jgi:hypothetical protein
MSKNNHPSTLIVDAIAPQLAAALAAVDVAAERETIDTIEAELSRRAEAAEKLSDERGNVEEQLRLLAERGGDDPLILADALLSGETDKAPGEEARLSARLEQIDSILAAFDVRSAELRDRRKECQAAMADKLKEAGAGIEKLIRTAVSEMLSSAQGIIAVIEKATANDWYYAKRDINTAAYQWMKHTDTPVAPSGLTPQALLDVLEAHEATIRAGGGAIIRDLTPAPKVREERPEPIREQEPYVPGLGGGAAIRPNGRAGPHITFI